LPYSVSILAGGATGNYQWSFAPGVSWLQGVAASGSDTATLSGSPPAGAVGTTSRIAATVVSPPGCTSAACSVTTNHGVSVVPDPALASPVTLPVATIGASYQAPLHVTSGTGTPPFTWSLVNGTLPAGLYLQSDGTITGWPSTSAVPTTVTVRVTDRWQATAEAVVTVPIGVQITTTTLPDGQVGTPYTATLQARGGTAPYTWSVVSGSLPPGLNLSSSGTLSGTPTATGTASFTVQAQDQAGLSAEQTLTLTVPALQVTTTSPLPTAYVQSLYDYPLSASGGEPPYTWTLASGSTLPPGLSLSSAGTLSGTPTSAGTYSFTVEAQDAEHPAETATANLSLIVNPQPISLTPLSITIQSVMPPPTVVSVTPSSTGVTATIDDFCGPTTVTVAGQGSGPYVWSVTPGLPDGWTLTQGSDTATLSGGPVTYGTYQGKIVLSNPYGESASYTYDVTVDPGQCGSSGGSTTSLSATLPAP
jgi:hypothetical protein